MSESTSTTQPARTQPSSTQPSATQPLPVQVGNTHAVTDAGTDLDRLAGRRFDAVLFDMDGTLIDSMPGALRAWATWAAEHGVAEGRLTSLGGRPATQIIDALLPPDRVEAGVARIGELETTMAEAGIDLLPGTAEALAALPADRVAIVTSCTRALLASRLAGSGLRAPREIITVDDVEHGKPHPEPFLLAARRLGAEPGRCLVVEDAPAGLAAGRAAGCATLAVGSTHPRYELDADAHAPDLAHVLFQVHDSGVTVAAAG